MLGSPSGLPLHVASGALSATTGPPSQVTGVPSPGLACPHGT